MKYYGFNDNTIKWFHSYLNNRTQFVEIRHENGNVSQSSHFSVSRGVPQGSILGPLIFALYCADITINITHCNFHIYADDIQLYISFKPSQTITAIRRLNEDLQRIAEWSDSNTLALNPNKCKYILFGTDKQRNKIINLCYPIKIGGNPIERVTDARNLGVVMDENLRFEKHTLNTVRNCFYRLKILYRIRDFLTTKIRTQLCESLVLSKFNYADAVIGPRLLVRSRNLIQRVQNACARYCFSVPPRAHVTPFLNNARILKMDYRWQLHFATLLFGIIKYKVPTYLYDKLHWASDNYSTLVTRGSSFLLLVPPHRTAAFQGSFRYAATKCWNNLPPPLRDLETQNGFRLKYKRFLLETQLKS